MKSQINETQNQIKKIKQAIERATLLKSTLEDYDKNNINKTFFEKYHAWKDDNGEIMKDHKGNTQTSFKFSDPLYSFEKGKRIYLHNGYYIKDIESTDRKYLIDKTVAEIESLKNNLVICEQYLERYKNINSNFEGFKAEYRELLIKYDFIKNANDIAEKLRFID